MTVKSIKHNKAKRMLIPSREEAGTEAASPKVRQQQPTRHYPLNPIVHRGQDPELFWLGKYGKEEVDSGQGLVDSRNLPTQHSTLDTLSVDIRSLYRHEHIAPEKIIQRLYRRVASDQWSVASGKQLDLFSMSELFGNSLQMDEIEKVSEYYQHADGWTNRLIQGDSLLVMTSLLEREGMAAKVQMIYIDPPYGIKYGSNWQMKLNNRNVKDGNDADLSGEPEQIKAYRDTWELGIHSYLSYLRDRLLVAKELLTESGSCFVQISDENVHLVRCLMDEVFGSENYVAIIAFKKPGQRSSDTLPIMTDFILWYAKTKEEVKFRPLLVEKSLSGLGGDHYTSVELLDGNVRPLTENERFSPSLLPSGAKVFETTSATSAGSQSGDGKFEFKGRAYYPPPHKHWSASVAGMKRLATAGRLVETGSTVRYKRYFDDFPYMYRDNRWDDAGLFGENIYVVQTSTTAVQCCLLMTTDPGDLVLDPTCGSGTTAFVAEQWGRRWITVDTSRIALNIAKTRLLTATYPYYRLYAEVTSGQWPVASQKKDSATNHYSQTTDHFFPDIRQGFVYKKVPHVTLGQIAQEEPFGEETLYDQPEVDRKKLRVSGPFTVETLQNFEPIAPEELDKAIPDTDELENFEERIFEHMKSAGVKNGIRNEQAIFTRVDRLNSGYLHAEGYFRGVVSGQWLVASLEEIQARNGAFEAQGKTWVLENSELKGFTGKLVKKGGKWTSEGSSSLAIHCPLTTNHYEERKAYIHIGPKFGTVSRQAVNEAVKECRTRGDADWLIILGFSFESNIENQNVTTSMGSFEVTKVRMHDDLMQDGLLKRDKKAASFVTIGEPDIGVVSGEWLVASNGKEIMLYDDFKKLSGIGSLEEINGLGREGISGDKGVPKGRSVRSDKSDAKGGGFDSIEHRRRAVEELSRRISAVFGRGERIAGGTGNAKRVGRKTEVSGAEEPAGTMRGDIADAERSRQSAEIQALTADDLPLTTRHYSLVTIRGLDIYDPVTDEVKARDVADIAYWMVDDDYDGSNFIVRQVFFCGGDKDEFAKWQRGLSDLAMTSAKRQAEKTLKIEIDDEAFARQYGHKSHPIEIKKKGQKIAVRVISQFGEECTKVLEV